MHNDRYPAEVSAEAAVGLTDNLRISVLYVEDERFVWKVMKELLELQGQFDVDTAYSVKDAYERLKQGQYDVIVSDYLLTEEDGLQFLKELRESGNSIPFIIFTGKGREEPAIKELLNLGADVYFGKHGEPEAVYRELAHGISEVVEKKRIEDALKSSQAKYKSLLQNIPGMFYRARPDWSTEIIANSKSVCGYTIQEFDSGRVNWLDIIHPDDKARVVKEGGIILEGPASIAQEYRIVDKESGVRWVEDHKTSFFSKNGVFEGIDGVVFDGTSRKKTEQALHASLDRYRSFIEVTEDLGWTTNAEGEVVEDTPSFRKFAGQTYEEIKGWGWSKALHPDDLEHATQIWKEATRTKSRYETEFRLRRHDGVYRYFIARGVPVFNEDGSIREWVGTCIDITERRKAEQTLKESEEKYRSLVELAPDGIVAVNAEGIVTSVNRSFLRLLGYDSEEEIVGKPFMELKTSRAEDIPKFQEMFMSLMKGESPSPVEFLYVRKDGTNRWAEVHPGLLTKEGNPVGAQVIMRDVTERKKAEKTLQESEERFRAIFEGANDGILVADIETRRFFFANPRICEITGFSLEELLKLGVSDIHPKKDLDYVIDSFTKLMQGKLTLAKDLPVLRKDERVVYCDVSARPMKIGSGEYLVGFFRDVTERKKAEEKINLLSSVVQQAPEGIAVSDLDGRILFANSAWLKMHGLDEYEEKDLVGKQVGRFYCRQQVESADPKVQSGGIFRGRVTQVRKDGTTFPALATLNPLRDENGRVIGIIRMAKILTEIVRDIRDTRSTNASCTEKNMTKGRVV